MKDADDVPKEEEQPKQEEGQSISGYVNQQHAKDIMEMGFSKNVAEKALFFTLQSGGTTEKAIEWIEQHCDDVDFQEELKIVG